ncbi:hypothetical protein SVIOM74S_01682 [Streptomyces violarus]
MPYETRVADPSGLTSDSRAATRATGSLTDRSSSTVGEPRISTGSVSGSLSKTREPPSSSRWSYGRSGGALYEAHLPANWPTDSGDCTVIASPSRAFPSSAASRGGPIVCRVSGWTACRMCGEGQSGSPTQRPGRSSYAVEGGTLSCIHACSMGPSMTPLSTPLSQWSHHRTSSWR